jgi:hypothetical protein
MPSLDKISQKRRRKKSASLDDQTSCPAKENECIIATRCSPKSAKKGEENFTNASTNDMQSVVPYDTPVATAYYVKSAKKGEKRRTGKNDKNPHHNISDCQKISTEDFTASQCQPVLASQKGREKYTCLLCDFTSMDKSKYSRHILTKKHDRLKNAACEDLYYSCQLCNYTTYKKSNYDQHITSNKHIQMTAPTTMQPMFDSSNNIVIDKNIFYALMKDNSDFKNLLVEQSKELTNQFITFAKDFAKDQSDKMIELASKQNTTNNNTINNKQRYNFNLFLNEKCKDAMDINDFMESLEVGLDQLYYFGEHGYVNGITKILTDGLNKLDIYKRPMHCTDIRRDIMHVKDNGKWSRDTEHKYIKKLINNVSMRNTRTLSRWQDNNPECAVSDTAVCRVWFKLTRGTMNNGGAVGERNDMEIIKKISKNVYVEKSQIMSFV